MVGAWHRKLEDIVGLYVDRSCPRRQSSFGKAPGVRMGRLRPVSRPGLDGLPARTLSAILAETGDPKVDLLVLDVEGYELEALRGLDLDRHAPRWLLIESDRPSVLANFLGNRYRKAGALSHHDYLFERIDAAGR